MDANEQLLSARRLHHNGKLREADAACREILRRHPAFAPALFQLGLLTSETGRLGEAVELLSQAVAAEPNEAPYHNHLGVAVARSGNPDRAADCFRRAVELQPEYFEAHNNLGNVLRSQGRHDEAMAAYEMALRINPKYAEAHFNMGNVLRDQRRMEPAVAAYRRAIAIRPDLAEAHNNLGTALIEAGHDEQAIATFAELVRLAPKFAKGYNNLGVILQKLGRLDEAAARFRQAIAIDPHYAAAQRNLTAVLAQGGTQRHGRDAAVNARVREFIDQGVVLGKAGDLAGAAERLRKAIEIDPDNAKAHFNLGVALGDLHDFDGALAAFERAVQLDGAYAEAHHGLSMVHLQLGRFAEGWPRYEYRWKLPAAPKPYRHRQPAWHGEDLAGKTILLYSEQGIGDTIQFSRYVPIAADRAERVYSVCQEELERLFDQWPKVHQLRDRSQRLPAYDYHCAVTSLPLAFGTTMETIPTNVPYLRADPALAEKWKERLGAPGRMRVGLVWAGNPQHQNDRYRSISLSLLTPLGKRFSERVKFYGLQKGDAARQCTSVPELDVTDLSDGLNDFVDTAAAIACMDLVISVDTSVAHLAGALGARTWTMLAFASDWRWLLNRDDSPWYPTMRLFRQRVAGEWGEPLAEMMEAMEELVAV